MNPIILSKEKIDPYKLISNYENTYCDAKTIGAQSNFIGFMRNNNIQRDDVMAMDLEYYPEMTKFYLENLGEKVKDKFKLLNFMIAHRIGKVFPGDCIVVVACWTSHRKESMEAVEVILEDLKHNAPLWKKEYFIDNSSKWVEKNT
tara:strand:- start:1681 stop:2118 length:438 start_codon:yes stop_codon:yes gene_type:complete